jgi:hypothetical protein
MMMKKYDDEYYNYILRNIEPNEPNLKEKKAVFNIISDLTDRRGLGQEFENIDNDIQDEIVETWIDAIKKASL